MNQALQDVLAERTRQDAKWGVQNHDPITYLAILTEEVGELSQAALHTRFGGSKAGGLREEAVHTAAVALAIVECLDRGVWAWAAATEHQFHQDDRPPFGLCARCQQPLNNLSPGFGITRGGLAVCLPCMSPGEEVARAKGLV